VFWLTGCRRGRYLPTFTAAASIHAPMFFAPAFGRRAAYTSIPRTLAPITRANSNTRSHSSNSQNQPRLMNKPIIAGALHCTGMGWNRYETMNATMTRNSSNAATSTIRRALHRVLALRDDAFESHLAGMGEDGRAVALDALV
jgi:hypothetical protein